MVIAAASSVSTCTGRMHVWHLVDIGSIVFSSAKQALIPAFPMIPKRAADICLKLERDDGPCCKRRRLWSTDDYDPTRSLGSGAFGEVIEARHRTTGEAVAVKSLRLPTPPAAGEATPETNAATTDEVLGEAEFLLACRGHPSLVHLRALAINPNTGNVALIMERLGPSLHDVLYDNQHRAGRPFPEHDVRRIMLQLLEGARHMHSRKVMHRDIKPGNILAVLGSGGGSVADSVKICDFGLAASMADPPPHVRAGTRPYMAPEVLLGKCDYDALVDTWSLGCVMAELLTGRQLFETKDSDVEQVLQIFKVLGVPGPRTWPGYKSLPLAGTVPMPRVLHRNRLGRIVGKVCLSGEGFNVLRRLLSCNVDKRLSVSAALRSPWFTKDDVAAPVLSHGFLLH